MRVILRPGESPGGGWTCDVLVERVQRCFGLSNSRRVTCDASRVLVRKHYTVRSPCLGSLTPLSLIYLHAHRSDFYTSSPLSLSLSSPMSLHHLPVFLYSVCLLSTSSAVPICLQRHMILRILCYFALVSPPLPPSISSNSLKVFL